MNFLKSAIAIWLISNSNRNYAVTIMSEIYGVRIVSSLKPSTIFIQSSETVLNTSMLELFAQFFLDLLFPLLGIFKVFLGCAKVFPWYITSKVWFLLHGSFRVAVSASSTLLCLLYWCSFLPKEGAYSSVKICFYKYSFRRLL